MTLRRQLFIAISILFFGIFLGLIGLSVSGTRAYLEQQLASHAQDAASSLSYPLAKSLGENTPELANMQVTSMFDRGFFQQITIVDIHGKTLVQKTLPPVIEGVPSWFLVLVALETAPGEALLSAGWRQLGRVVVVSQPTHAYQYLWSSTLETAGWMGMVYLLALFLTRYLLLVILRPLSEIEHTAQEVAQKRFSQIAIRPKALELARVVRAMNAMSKRIAEFLDAESAKAENFRRQAYQDEVTGLDNRRSFDLRFNQLLDGDMQFSEAAVIGLEVNNLKAFNTETSYQRGNAFLTRVTKIVSQLLGQHAAILGRTGGTSFGFVVLGLDEEATKGLAQQLRDLLQQEIDLTAEGADISFSLGVVCFHKSDKRSQIMARLDLAIETARQSGRNALQFVMHDEGAEGAIGSLAWRELIQNALHENRWTLLGQPVVSLVKQELIHREIMSRLIGADGNLVPASKFLPMALRHRLMAEIDRSLLELVFRVIEAAGPEAKSLAVNMSNQSLESKEFVKWLDARLAGLGQAARHLSFELTEYGCAIDIEAAKRFASMVRARHASFGIDHFGLAPNSLQILREVPPDYIKLAAGLIQEGQNSADAHSLIQSIVALARSLEVEVIAQGVETAEQVDMLLNDQIAGGQGYHFGMPLPDGLNN